MSLAAVFIAHGGQKLLGAWGGFGLAVLVSLTEFGGGILLLFGALTRWLALAIAMGVAIWKVHLPHGVFLNWTIAPGQGHGYEFNVVLIGALACLVFTGPRRAVRRRPARALGGSGGGGPRPAQGR